MKLKPNLAKSVKPNLAKRMKRGSSEDFKYYLAKATKTKILTIITTLFDLGLKLQASNDSFLLDRNHFLDLEVT